MIHILRERATKQQLEEMLQTLNSYVKLAVDVRRGILAGGGKMHADCEAVRLEDGSQQTDVWGADWYPGNQEVVYESLINIRPRQNNRSIEIQDPGLREQIDRVVRPLLEGIGLTLKQSKLGI